MACIASEKPLGMLIPVDQRSAPLVAIAAYHPHAQPLRIVCVSWRTRYRGIDKLHFLKRPAIMTHAASRWNEKFKTVIGQSVFGLNISGNLGP